MREAAKKKILVVDDEPDVCVYLARLLEEHGYSVACAADGNEATRQIEREKPDLIALDLSMPNKSGVRFYRELRSNPQLQGVRVIFVTGVTGPGGPESTERFYSTRRQVPPPDGFVPKPIDPEEMLKLVDRLLGEQSRTATPA
jgi:CheY-like chemotaxis protein